MEFGGIQFQKIRLIIVSGIIRFSWTLIILTSGIILLVQETNKIFGDWENSYWPFGILFVILSGYGIFRVGLQFKVFFHLKSELRPIQHPPTTTTITYNTPTSGPGISNREPNVIIRP